MKEKDSMGGAEGLGARLNFRGAQERRARARRNDKRMWKRGNFFIDHNDSFNSDMTSFIYILFIL